MSRSTERISCLKLSFTSDCSIVVQNVMTNESNHSGNEAHDGHTQKNVCIEISLTMSKAVGLYFIKIIKKCVFE